MPYVLLWCINESLSDLRTRPWPPPPGSGLGRGAARPPAPPPRAEAGPHPKIRKTQKGGPAQQEREGQPPEDAEDGGALPVLCFAVGHKRSGPRLLKHWFISFKKKKHGC